MIPDEHAQRIKELWAHLFGDLDGYLITFTGRQTAEPSTQPRACYALGRKSHRNADSTLGLVTSRFPFPAFLSRF
jgi:hypothetical protein